MRDPVPDPLAPDIELLAEAACCPGRACGPIFETPLLEQAFNRLRDFVSSRNAGTSIVPAGAGRPPNPAEDASHD